MSHSVPSAAAAFDLAALKRALEQSDADSLLALYDEDAEMEIIDRNRPPSAPLRLVGRPAIAAFWRDVCARDMTHAVGEAVSDAHRAAFVERCAYPDGCHVVSAMTLELRDGRIRRHLTVQAWDEVSCG
ncbi:nuclear transport factor 2 family protein [Roseomonas eburnea]|uniref:Nuclear transport factor 2 family protein n=1 Tax=Neoroseomonas eburnea TaxID=1346889 RepID=A0A9X9XF55_9PROT|nr:nuclear transport factor 2 family protein [Neoroseomonas eburnea]MBR0682341.1 nuclear transport factor 2 family protein [Neoroseomonas eburnea]